MIPPLLSLISPYRPLFSLISPYRPLFSLITLFLLISFTHIALADDPHKPIETSTRAHLYKYPMHSKVVRTIKLPKQGYPEGILVGKYEILLNNGSGGATYAIDIASGKITSYIEPVATFSEGITGDNKGNYWVTDWDTKKIYRVRIEKSKMVPESGFSFEPAHPAGVVWVSPYLYVITWTRGLGTKYHIVKLDRDFSIIKRERLKGISEPSQIAWDGKNFWVSSWFNQCVYKLDPVTFKIKSFFKTPIKKVTGVAWDGKNFWVTGTDDDLYEIEVKQ